MHAPENLDPCAPVARILHADTNVPVSELVERARTADLVRVRVDEFVDGRVFSQVRALAESPEFAGRVEVHGDLLPEQAELLIRYGVSEVVLENGLERADSPRCLRAGYPEDHICRNTENSQGAKR